SLGGIFCLYLGYRIFIKGTERQFNLFSDLKGWKFKLANTAPGIFFAILGAIILCSPIIVNAISIMQKQSFINSYSTKLILDELRKRNESTSASKLNKKASVSDSLVESSSTETDNNHKPLNKAIVTTNELHLRAKPGTYHRIIGSLNKGDLVIIKDTKGEWHRVSTAEFEDGWVHGEYVRVLENGSGEVKVGGRTKPSGQYADIKG
ncbi:MAG: SH3 domain-containing protein, partial [Syntrophobacterales bacterium]